MTDTLSPRYFRQQDGVVLGPVDLDTLRDWARQARIGPGTEISTDGVRWVAPHSVPELELEWVVYLPDGRLFGPIHHAAVSELRKMRMIPEEAVARSIRFKDQPEEANVQAALTRLESENQRLKSELGKARAEYETSSRELAGLRRQAAELSAELERRSAAPGAEEPQEAHDTPPPASDRPPQAQRPKRTPPPRGNYDRTCSKCGHPFATRTTRPLWMRLVPGSRLLVCDGCGFRFMIVARREKPSGPKKSD